MSEGTTPRSKRTASAAGPVASRGDGDAPAATVSSESAERDRRRYARWVIVAAVVFAVLMSILVVQRYRTFYGGRYDLGNMVQAVYNTAHGHFLQVTNAEGKQVSRLGIHVDPILAAFALPWLVWPSPVMLLVLQVVIVACAAWPAYRLGLRLLHDPRVAALLTVALLLYPPLQFAVLNEFHAVVLAIPFLLFAFLYIEEDKYLKALPFLVLAALCKEEIPLIIILMGGYFALRKRSWWPLLISAGALTYFLIAVGLVMPHFRVGQNPVLTRYSDYGQGAGSVAKNVFLKPGQTLHDLLAWSNIHYWLQLLWPFGFLSLLSPLTTLIAVPEYLLNALATQVYQRSIEFHYVAGEIPFLFVAMLLGLRRLHGWLDPKPKALPRGGTRKAAASARPVQLVTLAWVVLALAVAGNYVMGPLPFSLPGAARDGKDYQVSGHAQVLAEAVGMIPGDGGVPVSTANDAGSHLSARRVVYSWPHFAGAKWVIVDEKSPYVFDKPDTVRDSQALGALVLDQSFQSVFAKDGVYVFKYVGGAPPPGTTPGGGQTSPPSNASPKGTTSPAPTATASP